MHKVLTRFLEFNKLLVHGKCSDETLNAKLENIPRIDLTPIEQLFLNYLRVPEYPMSVVEKDAVLPLASIADIVREQGGNPGEYAGFCIESLSTPKIIVSGTPRIVDGLPYLPQSLVDAGHNFNIDMVRAFSYRCYGVVDATDVQKKLAQYVYTIVNEGQSLELPNQFVESFVDFCVEAQVHPQDLGRTVVVVNDLSVVGDKFDCLFCWANGRHTAVQLFIMKSNGREIAKVILPSDTFFKLFGDDGSSILTLIMKNEKLVQKVDKK